MVNDRPISEHEGALFDAVQVLAKTLLELGADGNVLRTRLMAARESASAAGNHHGAATLDMLVGALFAPPGPPSKPSLRVV